MFGRSAKHRVARLDRWSNMNDERGARANLVFTQVESGRGRLPARGWQGRDGMAGSLTGPLCKRHWLTPGPNPLNACIPGIRAISSVGRASRLHREGRRFEPVIAHHFPDLQTYSRRTSLIASAIQAGSATTCWRCPLPRGSRWSLPGLSPLGDSRPIRRPNR